MSVRHTARGKDSMPESTTVLEFPPLRPEKAALVVVDMINHQLTRGRGMLGCMEKDGIAIEYFLHEVFDVVVPNTQRLIRACRQCGAKIAYLRAGCYQKDFSDALGHFKATFRTYEAREGTWGCQVIDALQPEDGDIVLIKTGSGGFYTSNIDSILRNAGIGDILVTGVVTNGCVLTTVAGAFDRGYNVHLVSDAAATFSERLQNMSLEIIGAYMARVQSTDEVVEAIGRRSKKGQLVA